MKTETFGQYMWSEFRANWRRILFASCVIALGATIFVILAFL